MSARPGSDRERQRIVRIEKLAPTGEGIVRTEDGVGFVDRALPGELVATIVYQVKKKFWRGSLSAVREPSPDRVEGPHAGCAGCDWAHFEPEAARRAKRTLFLETMQRLSRIDPALFGELPVEASPAGHRLRTRLHAARGGSGLLRPRQPPCRPGRRLRGDRGPDARSLAADRGGRRAVAGRGDGGGASREHPGRPAAPPGEPVGRAAGRRRSSRPRWPPTSRA